MGASATAHWLAREGALAASLALALIVTPVPVAAGTGPHMVKDINPTGSSNPMSLTNVNGTLFFAARDGSSSDRAHGQELWRSNGTAAGTRMVADIRPGRRGSQPRDLINVGGTLFFTADDGIHGRELWKSDGTAAGTRLVNDIVKGRGEPALLDFTAVGSRVFFVRRIDCGAWCERNALWLSDGTKAGTKQVYGTATSWVDSLTNVHGTVLFSDGFHLWKTNGTRTTEVKSFSNGLWDLTAVGGTLFFVRGKQLWKSDGTTKGTVRVARFGTNEGPADLTRYGTRLAFLAGPQGLDLWISDGTATGTRRVDSLEPSSESESSMLVVGATLFIATAYGPDGSHVWVSGGTSGTTVALQAFDEPPEELTRVGDHVCFVGFKTGGTWEVWESDGTTAGTVAVTAFGVGGRVPYGLTGMNDTLYFAATDGVHGQELWSYVP